MLPRTAAAALLATVVACGFPQGQAPPQDAGWTAQRQAMVEQQVRRRGVASERVLEAMRRVPRHLFVPDAVRSQAYRGPSPANRLRPDHLPALHRRFHDGGAGRRSRLTVCWKLAPARATRLRCWRLLASHVYTIEIVEPLAARARTLLAERGYRNIDVRTGNGYLGWPEQAPVRSHHGDRGARRGAASTRAATQDRWSDGYSGWFGDTAASHSAAHPIRDGDAVDAARAVRADDGKAGFQALGSGLRPRALALGLGLLRSLPHTVRRSRAGFRPALLLLMNHPMQTDRGEPERSLLQEAAARGLRISAGNGAVCLDFRRGRRPRAAGFHFSRHPAREGREGVGCADRAPLVVVHFLAVETQSTDRSCMVQCTGFHGRAHGSRRGSGYGRGGPREPWRPRLAPYGVYDTPPCSTRS